MNFIHNIQRRLLLNHPILWSSRIVPTLILSGLFNVLLFAFFYFFSSPYDPSYSFVTWSSFLTLCSIIAVIIYLIFLLRFNHFKVFGILKWSDFSFQFLLFFITLGSIIAWPFMPRIAAHMATSTRYDLNEMTLDLREAYLTANQLEYTQATAPYREVNIQIGVATDELETDNVNNILKLASEDDIDKSRYVKLERTSDSTFIGYERISLVCNNYLYGAWNTDEFNEEIYESLPQKIENAAQKKERLNELFGKYIGGYNGSIYSTPDNTIEDISAATIVDYNDVEYNETVCDKYRLTEMSNSVSNISDKIIDDSAFEFIFRFWFYFTLFAAVLLIIFRYMSPRTFLWTLLFTFLLFVFTVIVMISADFETVGLLTIMLLYYLVFIAIAISIFFSKSRNVFQGIALNLSFFCLFLVPLVVTGLYIELNKNSFYEYYWNSSTIETAFRRAEMIGLALVFLSALFFHSRLFYKWYSLPEE